MNPNPQSTLLRIAHALDPIAIRSGRISAWLIIPMVLSLSYEVVAREVSAMTVRSIRRTVSGFPQSVVDTMGEVAGEIVSAGGIPAGPPTVLYYDEEFNPDKADVEVAFPVVSAGGKLTP